MSSTQQTSSANNNNNVLGKPKGKTKKKGEKMDVPLFFSNVPLNASWATMMENDTDNDDITPPTKYNLPEAPKALSDQIDMSQIPTEPPFKVHLRNIQFEVKVEDLQNHFKKLNITDVQLINERSYCGATIEFASRQDLIEAIDQPNKTIRGRVYTMSLRDDRDRDRGRGGRTGDRGAGFGRDSTPNDWRSAPDAATIPPASIDPYNHGGGGGYNRGGARAGRYNDDYPPRNDYGRGGGYNDRQMNDRGFDDRYSNRPPRNNDYGGSRSGNWSRDNDPMTHDSGFDNTSDDWRHGAPPQIQPPREYEHRRHHTGPLPQVTRSPPRYKDPQRAIHPPRMNDTYRNDSYDDNYRQQPVNERRQHDEASMDRRPDLYDVPPSSSSRRGQDYERSGHRNPPLMDHPPRERLSSTRSNISDHVIGDQQSTSYEGQQPQAPVVPKERKSFLNPSILKALTENRTDNKPSSYNSIFGEAKPVDTSKKEMEIEKKILSSKPSAVAATVPDPAAAPISSTSPAGTPPPRDSESSETVPVTGGNNSSIPSSRTGGGEYQDAPIAPRYTRGRANGGIGGMDRNRQISGGQRRDYDHDRNGALRNRNDGGRPRGDNRNMRNDHRRGPGDGSREFWPNSGNTGGNRRYNSDRGGDRRLNYEDNMRGGASRFDRGMQMRSHGGGYDRYHSSGSDFIEKDDSEHINQYVSSNRYDRLNETEDPTLE